MPKEITIEYGPYVAWGKLAHRTARLENLKEKLEFHDFRVTLVPISIKDVVILKSGDKTLFEYAFKCSKLALIIVLNERFLCQINRLGSIRELEWGGQKDPIADEIVTNILRQFGME